jgi:hypothetical protein
MTLVVISVIWVISEAVHANRFGTVEFTTIDTTGRLFNIEISSFFILERKNIPLKLSTSQHTLKSVAKLGLNFGGGYEKH